MGRIDRQIQTLKNCLLQRAPISNWLFWLMGVSILLMLVFFHLELDNFNDLDRIAWNQQTLIEWQQEIIDRYAVPIPEPLRPDVAPY